jgi:hypothetical protein
MKHIFVVVIVAAFLTACGDFSITCASLPRPAVRASIADSVTGLGAAYTASLILQNDAVYDSSFFDEDDGVTADSDTRLPFEVSSRTREPGTYTVRVRRSGYAVKSIQSVRVDHERCGPVATHLDVRLQPLH